MRVLLDECIDWRLLRELPGIEARTVAQMGWRQTNNGALLALAAAEFDVFVTVDKNLAFQQNVQALPIAVVVLRMVKVHGFGTSAGWLRRCEQRFPR